jgi:hypothetical protein
MADLRSSLMNDEATRPAKFAPEQFSAASPLGSG